MVRAHVVPTGLMKRLSKPGYLVWMYSCASASFHAESASWNTRKQPSMTVPA